LNPLFLLITGRYGSRIVKKYSYSSQQSNSRIKKEVNSFSTASDVSIIEESDTTSEDRSAVEVIHCSTCTCEKIHNGSNSSSTQEVEEAVPKWSFYKRILPNTPSLLAFSSEEGKLLFRETLSTSDAANAFFPLSEQFVTQSEPAFCGLTTLAMVLNALSIDPNIRWRGGWRWFDEQVLIHSCCMDMDTVKRVGVTLDQFVSVARCNGAKAFLRRPQATLWTQQEFRNEIRQMTKQTNGFLVVSYSRQTLGQTGGMSLSFIVES
jgi:glutathione gamma-glutamylcysteinyltransferase